MSIKVKECTMVCPAKETPNEALWLSKLDMMIRMPFSHTNVLFIYHHPNCYNETNTSPPSPLPSSSNFFDINIMKESLSRALVPFYPMAGRVKFNDENGRYEIDCNAKGALFIEAEAIQALAEFGDYSNPNSELRKLVFPVCDYSKELSSFPLLLVQLTRFDCGGVCLGFAQHHHVADGTSHLHFINSWARIAKGLDLIVHPIHDRASYVAPRDPPPQVKFRHLEYEPPLPLLPPNGLSGAMVTEMECTFKLAKDQVDTLKLQATSNEEELSYKLSTFVVLAGHVWRSACKARGLANDQDVKLYIPVNGRSRLKNTVPQGYCGNLIFYASCIEKAGDVTCKPLCYIVTKINKAVLKMNDIEYLRSAIDYVESYPDITALVRGPHTSNCPNLSINSWARLPVHDADFGWDKPQFTGISGIKYDGLTYIIPSSNGDGSFSVSIKLFTPHMALFKNYFYDF